MGGRRISIVIAFVLLAGGGCFLGSFSDLQGGGATDASTDAPVTDASTDAFSGGDASQGIDSAAGGSFCATQFDASFCDDFDQLDAAPLAKWQPPNIADGGSLSVTASGLSAPNALVAVISQNDGGTNIAANVSYIVPGTVHFVRLQYDLFVEKYDKTSNAAAFINATDERVGLADTELRVYLDNTGAGLGAVITASDGGSSYPFIGPKLIFTSGVWHHIEIDTDYSQTPAAVTFSYDYSVVVSDSGVPGAIYGPGLVTVEGAIQYARAPTAGWKVRVDNLAVFTE